MDHTFANVQILKEALDKNITCKIINENNEITLINKNTTWTQNLHFKYISLIPFTDVVSGITLIGFKYPLQNATLKLGESIGISNEQLEDNATIRIKTGILLLIKSRD